MEEFGASINSENQFKAACQAACQQCVQPPNKPGKTLYTLLSLAGSGDVTRRSFRAEFPEASYRNHGPISKCGKNHAINHPFKGMVNIPPIYGDLGDGLWLFYPHCRVFLKKTLKTIPRTSSCLDCSGCHFEQLFVLCSWCWSSCSLILLVHLCYVWHWEKKLLVYVGWREVAQSIMEHL